MGMKVGHIEIIGTDGKKLQDFFTDAKVPRGVRGRIPLLCDEEKICWIMGHPLDDRVKVTSETESVLVVRRHGCE